LTSLVSLTSISDDADTYHGAPVGVQIVGRKFEEEKVLGIAEAIDAALRSANNMN
jgi:amidase